MKLKIKIMNKKLFVVMMSCLMLLGMVHMTKQVFAETQHNDVFTDIKLTKADLETPVGSIGHGQQMQLVAKFSLPNNKVHEGDKTVLPLPKELEIFKKETFPIKNANGDLIANAVTDPDTKTITMTYTNFVDSHSDITGSLHVTVMIDSTVVKEPKELKLKISMGGVHIFDLGKLNYTGVQGDNPNESLLKWSYFDKDDPTIVHCRIRVNGKGGNFSYIKVKDTLESHSVSYIKESVEVKKGKWKLPAGGGYYFLENETDVTSQFPPTYNGNSFTIQFNNIQGEGYFIKYDVKLGYAPVNQEKIENRIFGETNSQILINTVNVAIYQQSGGEANGYNYTIKIHKESEDGQALSGAIFEVIRDSSQAKIGEITTGNDGNGSLSGLLKDNYTIKEKKAPVGYMPLTDSIHITPADFGTDKAVLKTIKNKKVPKINICGKKTWDDANDQDGKRPEKITVNLLKNGTKFKSTEATKANGWKYEFTSLDKYENGQEIKYTVEEENVEGYTSTVKGNAKDGFIITNTRTPEKTSISVTKTWDDAND
ncbi:MAG: Cna B-type domain-containing protein, partial [Eggerthia catenaformis]|uniref:Cna B-type domain-containing protein n=1 Tax=Eggerthia catenaformis TaxID=31973 RepID=UPI003F9F9970